MHLSVGVKASIYTLNGQTLSNVTTQSYITNRGS